jgi:hypothetical protein
MALLLLRIKLAGFPLLPKSLELRVLAKRPKKEFDMAKINIKGSGKATSNYEQNVRGSGRHTSIPGVEDVSGKGSAGGSLYPPLPKKSNKTQKTTPSNPTGRVSSPTSKTIMP